MQPGGVRIVYSPDAIATPVAQTASSVTVLTRQELEAQQRRTVPDALMQVPGLNVVQTGSPGGQTSVFMRGTNANHVKVLIDGIDVSDPSNPNGSFDFGQLLTQDLARIEVLRGPQSGLYGADAVGGVISLTTKAGSGPPRATASIEGGSFGTLNQTLGLSGSTSIFNYAFNVIHLRATDTPVTPPDLLPPGQIAKNNYYDNWTYSTRVGADISDRLSVNGVLRYTQSKLLFTNDSGFPSAPDAIRSTQIDQQLYTRGEVVWKPIDVMANTFGINYTDAFSNNKSPTVDPNRTDGERLKFDWRAATILAPGQTLVTGAERENDRLDNGSLVAKNGNSGGFVELQQDFFKRVFLTSNVRYDDNDNFGGALTYRVAPAVILPGTETKLKASYGTGFKAPTLSQLYVDFPAFGFFANRNLKPEESSGVDAGFEQPLFNDRARFGATYFHNDIKNLIYYNADFTTNINIGRATTQGAETFAQARITDRLGVRLDYTYTLARDDVLMQTLLRRPKNKGSVTADYKPLDSLTLSATLIVLGQFVDGNRDFSVPRLINPGYSLLNLAASYDIDGHTTVFSRIDNLFNKQYQDPTGFLRPGLGIYGGVRVAAF